MEITIFTPTYNRAYKIQELYNSLKKQTFRDFEWIVIDDGSTDETLQLFDKILSEPCFFKISYERVNNGGKHRAINRGIKKASGRLFFIVDSDDYLPQDSLETIIKYEATIPIEQKQNFAGISGLKGANKDEFVGKTFSGEYLDCTYLDASSNHILGDKSEVYYTEILKKFPFPEFENEKFIPESVVWNLIGKAGYKLRYFNKVIYFFEYLEDGLTNQGDEKYKSIPKGYGLYIYQLITYRNFPNITKWELVFNYYRMFHESLSNSQMAKNLKMNACKFYFRMLGIRLFYKIYNR